MRVLGLDFGSKTIGVAISDPLGLTAQGVEIIRREEENNLVGSIERLRQLVDFYQVDYILLGNPKNLNNTEGERVQKTIRFKKRIKKELNIPVKMWDERLSTVAAERELISLDMSRERRKQVIDMQAAVFILQGYLDSLKLRKEDMEND